MKAQKSVGHSVHRCRVVVIDDHPLLREGLRARLALEPDLELVGEYDAVQGAIEFLKANPCDIVLLDLALADGSGLVLLEALQERLPQISVVVLSSYDEVFYAERSIRAGARGYLMKTRGASSVVEALRNVRKGRVVLSEEIEARLKESLTERGDEWPVDPFDSLSTRELEVLRLLGLGRAATAIASELNLSAATVETYKTRLKSKLKTRSPHELLVQSILYLNRYPD